MTLTKLGAIEKLREIRERSASLELESSNRARDLAGAKASLFEEHLQVQTESVRTQQTQLYEGMIGRQVTSEDLETVVSKVDTRNAELDILAQECGKAKDAAVSAGAVAEQARVKHARVFRAQQKWAALMKREAEVSQKSENHREELTIEDSLRHLGRVGKQP